MLHLSLLHLSRRHPRWRHVGAYDAHALIWTAFPGIDREKGERPFLFSLDTHADRHSLLVQSDRPPVWPDLDGAVIQLKTFDPRPPEAGTEARFFLRANPTAALMNPDRGVRGARIAVGTRAHYDRAEGEPEAYAAWREAELRAWLRRHANGVTFDDADVIVGPSVRRRVARPRPDHRKAPMIFDEVEFTGRLTVTDPDAFAAVRTTGLGRGRAFGFGLMMIRPLAAQ